VKSELLTGQERIHDLDSFENKIASINKSFLAIILYFQLECTLEEYFPFERLKYLRRIKIEEIRIHSNKRVH